MFELWSHDLVDRESAPSLEETCTTLRDGLAALWRKTLEQGVQDDGRPTFTEFSLRGEGRTRFLPRDPFRNEHLALLRRRSLERAGFVDEVVQLHLEHFERSDVSLGWLVAATTVVPPHVQSILDVMAQHLGAHASFLPRADGARQSGPIVLLPLLEAGAWRVEVRDWDGAFVVIVSDGEARVELDDVSTCHVLRDALLEAGVATR